MICEIPLKELETYAFLDPAGGKSTIKKVRSRSAIVVIHADNMRRIFVRHVWADRVSTQKIIETLFQVNEQFKPRLFGIEANAQQSLFADSVRIQAQLQKKKVPIVPVLQPTKVDKEFRIRSVLQPIVENGWLFWLTKHVELEAELRVFPHGHTMDIVDTLASVISMVPKRGTQRRFDSEVEDLRQYLMSRGAKPWEIEATISEVMGRRNE